MEKYIGIKYVIDGIYGQVEYYKLIIESNFDKTFERYTNSLKYGDQPDVKFSVSIIDECGLNLFKKYDIEGLPRYLNIDMGTYFRMAQLREMKVNNKSVVIDNFIASDIPLEEIVEKVSKKIIESLRRRGSQI